MGWANGTAAHRPFPHHHFERHDLEEPTGLVDRRSYLLDLRHIRDITREHAAAGKVLGRRTNGLPRIGHIEDDAIRCNAFNKVRDFTHAEIEPFWDGTEEPCDTLLGEPRVIRPSLDADNPPGGADSSRQHHREATRSRTGLEHRHTGTDIGPDDQGCGVLRIEDGRTTRHLEDVVGEAGPEHGEVGAACCLE